MANRRCLLLNTSQKAAKRGAPRATCFFVRRALGRYGRLIWTLGCRLNTDPFPSPLLHVPEKATQSKMLNADQDGTME
jgi:hypothetical protein